MENPASVFEKQSYTQMPSNHDRNRKKNMVVFAVIMVLLITNVFLLVKVLENDKKVHQQEKVIVSTRIEKDALLAQLKEERDHFEKIKSENASLNKRLGERDREIKSQMEQIEKLINSGDEAKLKRAKSELEKLRKMSDRYIAEIATLKKENNTLSTANATLAESLTEEKSRNENLVKENTSLAAKVAIGSLLKTQFLSARPVRYKASGKEVEVNRANRVEKVKVCFTLLENSIAERGMKSVYLRVVSPEGATLSSSSETITYKGTPLAYSMKQEVYYENNDLDVCFFWKGNTYAPGTYAAELYSDGQQIGVTKFVLR